MKGIGILGGTFDPIHIGHLRMAIELREHLQLERVHLIPSFQPVHRNPPVASPEDRFAMVQKAVTNIPGLYADSREINRKGPSYTITTLEEIKAEMPDKPLYLLIGMDAFLDFNTWHQSQNIMQLAQIVIAHRPPLAIPEAHETKGFEHVTITALDISASEIRKLIALGRDPRYLLPDSVYEYIQQNGIYQK